MKRVFAVILPTMIALCVRAQKITWTYSTPDAKWIKGAALSSSVKKQTGELKYNPEYYLMKHLSHFVLPGAYRLKTSGGKDHLAFVNPTGEIVLMIVNTEEKEKETNVDEGKSITL